MADVYSNVAKHVVLQNGVKMPILGLGTSHTGGYSHAAVVHALKRCGYRLIDTAKRYGCESFIAESLIASEVPRNEVFLTTKCWPSDYGCKDTRAAFESSCKKLGTEYIDLYMLHWPNVPAWVTDRESFLQDTWRTLELLLDEERVRAVGVSNFFEDDLDILLNNCSVVPHVNQCEFHPLCNPTELRKFCIENKIQFEGYCPLGNGKILQEDTVKCIANNHGKTPAQVLIRWSIDHHVISIPKSTQEHRVKENSEVFDFKLKREEMDQLDRMPQNLTIMDRSTIQYKVDNPLPDGYRLNLIKPPHEP
ncbi:putative oxidoreductase ZK1290.5 isoform X2 [Oratosquilla oratoria]